MAIVFVIALYRYGGPKPEFTLLIKDNCLVTQSGVPPANFVTECRLLAESLNNVEGTIQAFKEEQGVILKFSGEIPAAIQQRVRNIWYACT